MSLTLKTSALTEVEAQFQNIVKHGSLVSQGKDEELWWIPPCAESEGLSFIQHQQRDKTGPATSLKGQQQCSDRTRRQKPTGCAARKDCTFSPGFLFLFFSPLLSLFVSSPAFFFSSHVAQVGLKLLPSSPWVLGLQASPPCSNSQESYSYYTC